MTDTFRAALARWSIVQAFDDRYELLGGLEENWQEDCLAAALRAAADQVVPYVHSPGGCREGERQCVRRELLAIATELDGGTTANQQG
jgi:hypothetical protein